MKCYILEKFFSVILLITITGIKFSIKKGQFISFYNKKSPMKSGHFTGDKNPGTVTNQIFINSTLLFLALPSEVLLF
jgi:hypothetical protein